MKKLIIGLAISIFTGIVIFIGCTKKTNEVTPLPQPVEVKAGNLRLSSDEGVFSVSKVESNGSSTAILFNPSATISIKKINVGAGSNTSTINKIAITPADKIASQSSSGSCPSLSEIEKLIANSQEVSGDDICKVLNFVSCVLSNPSQYGASQKDVEELVEELGSSETLQLICQFYACGSCANLKNISKTPVVEEKSEFTFDGNTYSGTSTCSDDSENSSTYYSITSGDNFFSYSKYSGSESISVRVNDVNYYSSSSSSISIEKNGNTVNISGSVRRSSSSSSKSVSATIRCK